MYLHLRSARVVVAAAVVVMRQAVVVQLEQDQLEAEVLSRDQPVMTMPPRNLMEAKKAAVPHQHRPHQRGHHQATRVQMQALVTMEALTMAQATRE